jgi:hypothetical protein
VASTICVTHLICAVGYRLLWSLGADKCDHFRQKVHLITLTGITVSGLNCISKAFKEHFAILLQFGKCKGYHFVIVIRYAS